MFEEIERQIKVLEGVRKRIIADKKFFEGVNDDVIYGLDLAIERINEEQGELTRMLHNILIYGEDLFKIKK